MTDDERKAMIVEAIERDLEAGREVEWRNGDDGLELGTDWGEEGILTAIVVGAPEYGNVRVAFTLTPDGMDGCDELRDLGAIGPL